MEFDLFFYHLNFFFKYTACRKFYYFIAIFHLFETSKNVRKEENRVITSRIRKSQKYAKHFCFVRFVFISVLELIINLQFLLMELKVKHGVLVHAINVRGVRYLR